MKLIFHAQAWDDYLHWQAHDRKILNRLNGLIKECARMPFTGAGKSEPLRGALSGWRSRRINQEHRLVCRPTEDGLLVAQCRYHHRHRPSGVRRPSLDSEPIRVMHSGNRTARPSPPLTLGCNKP